MINCNSCQLFDGHKCKEFGRQIGMSVCPYAKEKEPNNNFEKIQMLDIEGMADFIYGIMINVSMASIPASIFNKKVVIKNLIEWLNKKD